ncbi:copper transporter complex subunit Ctr4 [Coniosporium tulheliwenetii]|uniref:Copper transporter complex subunit Ctr4 n=1 Tax=Coniosporium tulheliwenetii TaxID=3383036 RepID=A0ACC2YU08_9PEZI|nr:copper transporter complex subunit Ctr4 [Cladosporium sp. JES 115]
MLLEGLRRAGKQYDRFIVPAFEKRSAARDEGGASASADEDSGKGRSTPSGTRAAAGSVLRRGFPPSAVQQAIRALFHMLQFAVAYVVMLLAMGLNGYIVFGIFAGAYGRIFCQLVDGRGSAG